VVVGCRRPWRQLSLFLLRSRLFALVVVPVGRLTVLAAVVCLGSVVVLMLSFAALRWWSCCTNLSSILIQNVLRHDLEKRDHRVKACYPQMEGWT
jgi:hypothetical protein